MRTDEPGGREEMGEVCEGEGVGEEGGADRGRDRFLRGVSVSGREKEGGVIRLFFDRCVFEDFLHLMYYSEQHPRMGTRHVE